MKILYGVQATGNGHITRARSMARALAAVGAEVDWVFSGRARDEMFDMEVFGDFRSFRGLTFAIESGRVRYGKTLEKNNLVQLYRDIQAFDVEGYDLVLNDFEPITAWAARRAKKKVIGLSHQNAFLHSIPKQGNNVFTDSFMRWFAPADLPIGLHWHHFDQPILPPLIEPSEFPNEPRTNHYLVYLPFNDLTSLKAELNRFPDHEFFVYQPVKEASDQGGIHIRPFSRDGFQRDLHHCEGVICNAGFELASEAIQLGKKLLVQPVAGQMEQQSNALALTQLGYGCVARRLNAQVIAPWLAQPQPAPLNYPNVAQALAQWISAGAQNFEQLHTELWRNITIPVPVPMPTP